jgi:hypothetical protein
MRIPRNVYAIKHNETQKIYVGSTCDVQKRIKAHLNDLRAKKHRNEDMQYDFNVFGENYSFFVLDTINKYDEKAKEFEWMEKLESNVRGKGYNYNDRHFTVTSKHFVFYDGEKTSLTDLAKKTGIRYEILYDRIVKNGMSAEQAVMGSKSKGKLKPETIELIRLIGESDDKKKAILKAFAVMKDYLLEKKGKALMEAGITAEMLDEMYSYEEDT